MCREYTFYCYCGHVYQKTTIPCKHWTSAIHSPKSQDDEPKKNSFNHLNRLGRSSRASSNYSSSSSSSSFLSLVSFGTVSYTTPSSRSLSQAISPLTAPARTPKNTTDANSPSRSNKQCSWHTPIPRLFPKLCSECESISHISEYVAQSPTIRLEMIRDWRTANESSKLGEWPVETDARLPGRRDSYGDSLLYFWSGKRARAQAFARARKVAARALSARAGVEVDGAYFGALAKEKAELMLVVKEENEMHRDHLGTPLGDPHFTSEDLQVARRVPGWDEVW